MANKTASSGIVRRWQAGAIRSSFSGTDSPSKTLDITGEGRFSSDLTLGNGSTPDLIFEQGDSSIIGPNNANFVIRSRGNDAAEGIFLKGADGAGIQILKDGKVGINDTTPTYALDVNGTGRFVGHVDLQSSCDVSGLLRINDKVGIQDGGWYTPTTTLGVDGTFKATGAATFSGDVYVTKTTSTLWIESTTVATAAKISLDAGGGNNCYLAVEGTTPGIGGGTASGDFVAYRGGHLWKANLTTFTTGADLSVTGNAIVAGNLTVNGTTTTIDTTNLLIEDPLMLLARVQSGTPTLDSGFIIERGSSTNVGMIWDESADQFAFINTTDTATTAGNVTIASYAPLQTAALTATTVTASGIVKINVSSDSSEFKIDGTSGAGNSISMQLSGSDGYINMTGANNLNIRIGSGYANIARFSSSGLAVTGTGSFTGALTGTSGTFSGNITGGAFGPIVLTSSTQSVKWPFTSGQSNSRSWGWIGEQGAYGYFQLYRSDASDGTLDTEVLRFDKSSNATFYGALTASGAIETTSVFTAGASSSSYAINVKRGSGGDPYIRWSTGSTERGRVSCGSGGFVLNSPTSVEGALTVSGGLEVGGGYNGSGVAISSGGVIQADGALTVDGLTTLKGVSSTYNYDWLFSNTGINKKFIVEESSGGNSNSGIQIRKKLMISGSQAIHNSNGAASWYGDVAFMGWDGDTWRRAGLIECVSEGTPANDVMAGSLRFGTNSGGTSTTEWMRILANGNVGIGTIAPAARLDVVGTARFLASSNSPIFVGTNQNIKIYASETYNRNLEFNMYDSTATAYRTVLFLDGTTAGSGRVGIGVTDPDASLEITALMDSSTFPTSPSDYTILLRKTTNTTGNYGAGIGCHDSSYVPASILFVDEGSGAATGIAFATGGTSPAERVRIDNAGNVGIGLTDPGRPLDVKSSAIAATGGIQLRASGDVNRVVRIYEATTGDGAIDLCKNDVGTTVLLQADGDSYFTGGNFGIGTTSLYAGTNVTSLTINAVSYPTIALKIGGTNNHVIMGYSTYLNIDAIGNRSIRLRTNDTNRLSIDGSGNVGIGLIAPLTTLDLCKIADTGERALRIQNSTTTFFAGVEKATSGNRFVGSSSDNAFIGTTSADGLELATNNNVRMYIKSDGNVGIGTTAPAAKLHVASSNGVKVTKFGDDITSHYKLSGNADHTLTLTCVSYYQAEVIITAHQTNGGNYNNLYIRGIWSNNHTSHHWDEIESVGSLTNSSFTFTIGQNGSTTNTGELKIVHDYVSGSFINMTVRVVEHGNTGSAPHAYSIS